MAFVCDFHACKQIHMNNAHIHIHTYEKIICELCYLSLGSLTKTTENHQNEDGLVAHTQFNTQSRLVRCVFGSLSIKKNPTKERKKKEITYTEQNVRRTDRTGILKKNMFTHCDKN